MVSGEITTSKNLAYFTDMSGLIPFTKPQDIFRHGVGIMLGSWELKVGSHFAASLLYRLVALTRTFIYITLFHSIHREVSV